MTGLTKDYGEWGTGLDINSLTDPTVLGLILIGVIIIMIILKLIENKER